MFYKKKHQTGLQEKAYSFHSNTVTHQYLATIMYISDNFQKYSCHINKSNK